MNKLRELNREGDWLIYKYNQLLLDPDIKNKQEVHDWFYCMVDSLIINGLPQFKFLYCDLTLIPFEKIKELFKITEEEDKKYCDKYKCLQWFEMIKKYKEFR